MPINPRERFEIFKRDDFRCQYCGRRAPVVSIEVEHVRPISRGGTGDQWNLVTACTTCNAGKWKTPLTREQTHRIDGHVPNLIAQLVAQAELPCVIERLIAISRGGRLIGDWVIDLEQLLDNVDAESWREVNA